MRRIPSPRPIPSHREPVLPAILFEACVTTTRQAEAAERAGAGRLELCARIGVGGTTPREATLRATLAATTIPVRVMIRPRPGTFVLGRQDLHAMRRAIAMARAAGAQGLVLGALTPDFQIDRDALDALIDAADSLPVTFHRAFDLVLDQLAGLDQLVELGVNRVLTSGGAPTARKGAPALARLLSHARGRIGIVAAGRIRPAGVAALVAETGIREVHAHLPEPARMRAMVAALAAA